MATKKEMERSGVVTLSLPILSEEDPLFPEKMRLSNVRNLSYNFDFPVSSSKSGMLKTLDQMVQTARLLYMHELELYFAEDDDFGPFSSRNELESLNSVLNIIHSVLATASGDAIELLQVLETATIGMIKSLGMENKVEMIAMNFNGDAEDSLLKWGESHGVKTKLKVAFFEGAGRGTVASEDLSIGDVALEVPESLIISEDLVYGSDVFDVLKDLDDITSETMLLLWSMRERYNPSSKFRIYFETLPEEFNTGLRFAIDALAVLDGTLLFEELTQAREHLRQQYDTLFPALSMKYPDLFKPELYTWEKYLWACELWYSNSMKVVLTDGKLKTCLIPIAGLLNHSLCPHILHYGRVDPVTKSLKFPLSRPCEAGEQCYLSYGSLSGSHLVTFYGFLPKGDNPYDIIPLDFDTSNVENDSSTLEETSKITHMVRGTWFSKSDQPYTYDLPSRLLTHLRAVLNCQNAESPAEISRIDICENDRMVLETVLSIFSPMLEGLGNSDDFDRVNASWDLKLALGYKDLQRRIISSIVTSCTSGLEMLEH
uniref:SET domain-containing protein n=1 Tax=Ananas comosus var. bracteatus TaxID=296719 RepID=A0A6V7QRL5_ANACO